MTYRQAGAGRRQQARLREEGGPGPAGYASETGRSGPVGEVLDEGAVPPVEGRRESCPTAKGLADSFDAVLNTSRFGFAKPDARVFAEAARRAGVPPQRCLFVDDTPAHVEAARERGLVGHHYRGIGQLRVVVTPLLR